MMEEDIKTIYYPGAGCHDSRFINVFKKLGYKRFILIEFEPKYDVYNKRELTDDEKERFWKRLKHAFGEYEEKGENHIYFPKDGVDYYHSTDANTFDYTKPGDLILSGFSNKIISDQFKNRIIYISSASVDIEVDYISRHFTLKYFKSDYDDENDYDGHEIFYNDTCTSCEFYPESDEKDIDVLTKGEHKTICYPMAGCDNAVLPLFKRLGYDHFILMDTKPNYDYRQEKELNEEEQEKFWKDIRIAFGEYEEKGNKHIYFPKDNIDYYYSIDEIEVDDGDLIVNHFYDSDFVNQFKDNLIFVSSFTGGVKIDYEARHNVLKYFTSYYEDGSEKVFHEDEEQSCRFIKPSGEYGGDNSSDDERELRYWDKIRSDEEDA